MFKFIKSLFGIHETNHEYWVRLDEIKVPSYFKLTRIVRKAHSFRGGWIAHLFYNLMCMLPLILYTYYNIIYVWKIIIDIQTQQYL